MLGDVCVEVGLSSGAFNVVTGRGDEVGVVLCVYKGVDKILFIGLL